MDNYTKLIEFTDEGLRTSTKPEILNVLTNMTVEAFGADFAVDEGSAWYIFLDSLSNSLDNVCTAARELYNAQGIINANGSNLDNIVSLAGIYRKKGEADEQLRNRAIKSVYSTATSVAESLESALLQLDYIEFARVIDNPEDGDEGMVVGEVTIAKHNIWVLVKVKDGVSIDPNDTTTDGAKREKEIAETILHYKSLGSGTMNYSQEGGTSAISKTGHIATVSIDGIDYEIKFNETAETSVYIKVVLNVDSTVVKTKEQKDNIIKSVSDAITNYVNSLNIGQDVLMSRVVSVISSTNTYTDYGYDVKKIQIGLDETLKDTDTMAKINPYEQAVPYTKDTTGTQKSTITVSIEGYDPNKTPDTTK